MWLAWFGWALALVSLALPAMDGLYGAMVLWMSFAIWPDVVLVRAGANPHEWHLLFAGPCNVFIYSSPFLLGGGASLRSRKVVAAIGVAMAMYAASLFFVLGAQGLAVGYYIWLAASVAIAVAGVRRMLERMP
jgi:hypothetical protein